jgi:hypothetical protein
VPGSKTHGKDVRLGEKHTAKRALCRAPEQKNARQRGLFAVRRGAKRTAINGTFAVRLYKRTAKALFLLLVLVTLPCVFRKTHNKVTIANFFVFHV